MRTVKEISGITGISVRTLHYYDEIGLLKPTTCSEAGYRLYDDKALETLQQILYFKEFELPLKDIKAILENPDFDQTAILHSQRRMLVSKKERINRMISSIDGILKGVNQMDFEVFNKSEMEELYQSAISNMDEQQKEVISEQYGSMERYHEHFLENALKPQAQKNFGKLLEWYGSKEKILEANKQSGGADAIKAYQDRIDSICRKLAGKTDIDASEFEVKELVGEYDFVVGQLFQMEDTEKYMLEMADMYLNNEKMIAVIDSQYGKGSSVYIGKAIREFYKAHDPGE